MFTLREYINQPCKQPVRAGSLEEKLLLDTHYTFCLKIKVLVFNQF